MGNVNRQTRQLDKKKWIINGLLFQMRCESWTVTTMSGIRNINFKLLFTWFTWLVEPNWIFSYHYPTVGREQFLNYVLHSNYLHWVVLHSEMIQRRYFVERGTPWSDHLFSEYLSFLYLVQVNNLSVRKCRFQWIYHKDTS